MEHMNGETARGYARGALPPSAQAHWGNHLITCEQCRELVRRERTLIGWLRLDEAPSDAPAGALDRLLTRMHEGRQRSWREWWRAMLPGMSLALLLGAAVGLAYRLATAPPLTPVTAQGTAVTPVEQAASRKLDALVALDRDPWLIDDYEAVRWLETRLGEQGDN
ncbi:MAG: hypothetical protein PVJ57_11405 [Phycisphaerae bacterium]|jgi:hypothetical protein